MAFFKVTVDDKVYEVEKLTFGDARLIKRECGITMDSFELDDPDYFVALVALAMLKERPMAKFADLVAEVEAWDLMDTFDQIVGSIESDALTADEPDPTQRAKPTRKKPAGD